MSTQETRAGAGPLREAPARLRAIDPRQYVVYVAFLLILAFFAVTLRDDGFLTQQNLLNIVRQTTPITVMAVGLVFVLSAGEIDLSLGSVVALSSLCAALALRDHGLVAGAAGGLGVGFGVGLLNGVFTTLLRLPSFLVTLATMGLVAGIARWSTDVASVAVENERFANWFGSGELGVMPRQATWAIAAVAAGLFV